MRGLVCRNGKRMACCLLLLCGLLFVLLPLRTSASSPGTGEGILGIRVFIGSEQKLQAREPFRLTLLHLKSGEERPVPFEAFDASQGCLDVSLPVGEYLVTGLTYLGHTEWIPREGYGCSREVTVSKEMDWILHVYTGRAAVANLERMEETAFIQDAEHDADGYRCVFMDENGQRYRIFWDADGNEQMEYLEPETAETTEAVEETPEKESKEPVPSEEAEPEEEPSDKQKAPVLSQAHKSSSNEGLLRLGILFGLLSLLTGCVAWLLWKKRR